MEWSYKGFDITVTAVAQPCESLSPVAQIKRKDRDDPEHWVTTDQSFQTAEAAELFGMILAREWIDERRT